MTHENFLRKIESGAIEFRERDVGASKSKEDRHPTTLFQRRAISTGGAQRRGPLPAGRKEGGSMRPLQSWPAQRAQREISQREISQREISQRGVSRRTKEPSQNQNSEGTSYNGELFPEDNGEKTLRPRDLHPQQVKLRNSGGESPAKSSKKQAVESLHGPLARAMRELTQAPAVMSRMTSRRKAQKERLQSDLQRSSSPNWNPEKTGRKSQGDGGNRYSHVESITTSRTGSSAASKVGASPRAKTGRQLSLQFDRVVDSVRSFESVQGS